MFTNLRYGFADTGHLFGLHHLMVEVDRRSRIQAADVYAQWRRDTRVHFNISRSGKSGQLDADAVCSVVDFLREAGMPWLSACVHPGVTLRDDRLAYASTLRIDVDDLPRTVPSELDKRVASVSVHQWTGSGLLELIEKHVPAHEGLYLVVEGEDIGHAKVWMAGLDRATRWTVVPNYNLNRIESAEFDEMMAGTNF